MPPRSLEATMKTLFTAETRPRMSSGVSIWISVWRTTTLMLSRAPITNMAASESQKFRDNPKTIVATPKPATAWSMVRPARRMGGKWASRTAMTMAPAASADRSVADDRADRFLGKVQHVAGKRGQQIGGPAQQHGEQVERDRGQDQLVAPDEADARHEAFQRDRRLPALRPVRGQEQRCPPARTAGRQRPRPGPTRHAPIGVKSR